MQIYADDFCEKFYKILNDYGIEQSINEKAISLLRRLEAREGRNKFYIEIREDWEKQLKQILCTSTSYKE